MNKKILLDSEINIIDEIKGDGNCFFLNLSYFFTKIQNYFFWEIIYLYIDSYKKEINKKSPYCLFEGKLICLYDYIPYIRKYKNFTGDLEIANSINLFKINIGVYYEKDSWR